MNVSTAFQGQLLSEIVVRPVTRDEEPRYQEQMDRHHHLGALPKIGETLWYVATWRGQWLAQLTLSAASPSTLCAVLLMIWIWSTVKCMM